MDRHRGMWSMDWIYHQCADLSEGVREHATRIGPEKFLAAPARRWLACRNGSDVAKPRGDADCR